jgi:hypothetical protein
MIVSGAALKALWLLAFLLMLASIFVRSRITSRLKRDHAETWNRIQDPDYVPHLFYPVSINARIDRWLEERGHRDLNDRELNRLILYSRLIGFIAVFVIPAAVVFTVLPFISH